MFENLKIICFNITLEEDSGYSQEKRDYVVITLKFTEGTENRSPDVNTGTKLKNIFLLYLLFLALLEQEYDNDNAGKSSVMIPQKERLPETEHGLWICVCVQRNVS